MAKTIGVAMIIKDDVAKVKTLYTALENYVDKFFFTVSDEQAAVEIKKFTKKGAVEYRPWTDDFAAARNSNHKLIDTDYWIWLDDDDILKGREHLRDMVEDMAGADVDIMYLPYHYKIDELGQTVSLQWRERIIRTSLKGEWKGIVHETFVWDEQVKTHRVDGVSIYHIKGPEDWDRSLHRNHELLLKAYNAKEKDPRYTHYLAISHAALEEYEEAIKLFLEYIEESGWPEEQYHSWIQIADACHQTEKYSQEIDAAQQAQKIYPQFPDAYYMMQQAYYAQDDHERSLEWFSMAESKPVPDTNRAKDPTAYKYKAKLLAAISLMSIGEPVEAHKFMLQVQKSQPKDPLFLELMPEVKRAYYEAVAIEKAQWLMQYAHDAKGTPMKVLEALPASLQGDMRLRDVRALVQPSVKWPEKSIVFYCGPGLEFWGPDTLDKGMGGSEEAIVYLSRALRDLGWKVVVYNDREEELQDGDNLVYRPWSMFNPKDEFDVLVAWRNPDFHRQMQTKARVRAIDMHDTPVGHQYISEENLKFIDKVFLKSQFQYDMADYIPKDKVAIISNGIVKEQFNA